MAGPETSDQKGLSLLEILIVVAVAGILASLSARPMGNYLARMQFRNSLDEIKRLVQATKSRSMMNPQVHCGIYFDAKSKPPQILSFRNLNDPKNQEYESGPDSLFMIPIVLRKDISLSLVPGYPETIVFRGDGSANSTAKVVVRFQDLADTLQVLASTGQVQVLL